MILSGRILRLGVASIGLVLALQACASPTTTGVACKGTTAEDHYECGYGYQYDQRDYPAAIREYSEALRLKPDYPEALNSRGLAYRRTHNPDAAILDFTALIELRPREVFAYNNRANAYLDKGDRQAAFSNETKALEIDPTFADAYYGRSNLYDGAEKIDGALQDLTEAIRFYGEAAAHSPSARVISWFENGRYGEASALNPKIREIDEYLADAYYRRSRVYAEAGDMAKANADLEEARRIDPTVVQRNQ
jgi:tetratricopeptide (TPR) repeat protein